MVEADIGIWEKSPEPGRISAGRGRPDGDLYSNLLKHQSFTGPEREQTGSHRLAESSCFRYQVFSRRNPCQPAGRRPEKPCRDGQFRHC